MFRSVLVGTVILFLSLNFVLADTFKSKIKDVDDEKRIVTVDVDGKEKKFEVTKDTKVYTISGKAKKGQPPPEIALTLSSIKDKDATVTTDKVDDKVVVTVIKIESAKKKKKAN